jgi:hypothetical protein
MNKTKIAKALLLPLVITVASLTSVAARAVPVDYSLMYSGSTAGSVGAGSFSWDPATSAFASFNWNFSPPGLLPSPDDALMANNWGRSIFGGTLGQFLFEILTGEDVHPAGCSAQSRCTFSSFNITSSSLTSVEFRSFGGGMSEYVFRNEGSVLFSGMLSLNRALAVSEPLSLSLFGIGLLGLAFRRRRAVD